MSLLAELHIPISFMNRITVFFPPAYVTLRFRDDFFMNMPFNVAIMCLDRGTG